MTIFYCLNIETPQLSSSSYIANDCQSVCLSIKHPCGTCDQILLLVGMLLSEICGLEVKVTLQLTVSMSSYRAHSGTCDQILLSVRRLFSESCLCGAPSLTRGPVCHLSFSVCSNLSAFASSIYVTCVLQFSNLYTMYTKLLSVPSRYNKLCSTSCYELKLPQ
jgi:hypothetical protein